MLPIPFTSTLRQQWLPWLALLLLPPLWLAFGWVTARADGLRPPISGAECLRVLRQARGPSLPFKITGSSGPFQAMWDWDRASDPDKAQVIDELITWLPVFLERPVSLQAYNFEDMHPAAYVLRVVGVDAAEPLEQRLLADPEPANAELMARTLQRITFGRFKDKQNTRLLALKARTNSARLTAVIDHVDKLTRHPSATEGTEE